KVGVFFITDKQFRCIHVYKRKETQSQSQGRDNVTAMIKMSMYILQGTDCGKILIFNYRTTQMVAILVDLDGTTVTAAQYHKKLPLLAFGAMNGNICVYYQ